MATKWTEAQQNVIDIRNRNVLVSAAAGSGKTAVLVERIIQKVTDSRNPLDIDRLLVVTFTNAAAAEMKERILNAIEAKIAENPEDEHLQKQTTYIHNANISTIHSFCLNVIRNNFSYIDIDPGFTIGDTAELDLMKSDVIEKVLEQYYQDRSEDFVNFIEQYSSSRSDSKIVELVLKLYTFSRSYPNPDEWLDMCEKQYNINSIEELERAGWMKNLMADIRMVINRASKKIHRCLELCYDDDGPYTYIDTVKQEVEYVEELEKKNEFIDIGNCILSFEPGNLSRKKDEGVSLQKKKHAQKMRNAFKADIANLKKNYFTTKLSEQVMSMQECYKSIKVLVRITRDFADMYDELKKEKNLVDFNDLEHMALDILTTRNESGEYVPTSAADELSEQFDEIMIDEYQDSNYIQELLLTSVSGERKKRPNMFMVGDVKQSIYKFRLARPELFIDKYDNFTVVDSLKNDIKLPGYNRRINLDRNFRSRQEVLSSVNYLFDQIMGRKLGGIEYDDENALHLGVEFAELPDGQSNDTELIIVQTKDEIEEISELSDKSTAELEAYAIAGRIKELVNSFMVYDRKKDKYRKCNYSDIAILLRSVTGTADIYSDVFEKEGIPAYCETDSGYFDAEEVITVLNMLRIIDNPKQDIPLVSVMTSPMFDISNDKLAFIRGEFPDVPYYEAVEKYCELHEDESELTRFRHLLDKYRNMSVYTNIYNIITAILDDTGYYNYITAMPGGKRRSANIDMLREKAVEYEKGMYKGLFNFIRYIEKIKKHDIDYGEATVISENDNTVRIMTIHKSKGLEFPVVFVSGLGKRMNKMDIKDKMVIHSDMGVGIDCILNDEKLKINTLIKKAISRRVELDNLGEELRVLYVALTRAREKLIMTGTVPEIETAFKKWIDAAYESHNKISPEILSKTLTYLDLVGYAMARNPEMYPLYDMYGIERPWNNCIADIDGGIRLNIKNLDDLIVDRVEQLTRLKMSKEMFENFDTKSIYDTDAGQELERCINYKYPYGIAGNIPSKMSVSELKYRLLEEEESEKGQELYASDSKYVPRFISGETRLTGAARGTAFHRILELLDYSVEPSEENYRIMVQKMFDSGKIDRSMQEVIEYDKLMEFRNSRIGMRMGNAFNQGTLKREAKFVMGIPASQADTSYPEDETVLVQGIIDAYFIENGKAVIVDYKTDKVDNIQELSDRYKIQLDYYAQAVERLSGYEVSEKIIYSIHLSEEIKL